MRWKIKMLLFCKCTESRNFTALSLSREFYCSVSRWPKVSLFENQCSEYGDVFYFGNVKWTKTIQKTGNLLIRAVEGVVYIRWKMFWLRTKAFLIHFLRFAFSRRHFLGWAFILISQQMMSKKKKTSLFFDAWQHRDNNKIDEHFKYAHIWFIYKTQTQSYECHDLWLIKTVIFHYSFTRIFLTMHISIILTADMKCAPTEFLWCFLLEKINKYSKWRTNSRWINVLTGNENPV